MTTSSPDLIAFRPADNKYSVRGFSAATIFLAVLAALSSVVWIFGLSLLEPMIMGLWGVCAAPLALAVVLLGIVPNFVLFRRYGSAYSRSGLITASVTLSVLIAQGAVVLVVPWPSRC